MTDLFEQAKEFVTRGVAAQRAVNKLFDNLCRKSNPDTSRDAAEKMVKSGALAKQEQEVYEAIDSYVHEIRIAGSLHYTKSDFITKEIAYQMVIIGFCHYFKAYDICRRRFSGLCNQGLIERIQAMDRGELLFNKKGKPIYEKRDGCCIWRLKNK